jgi:hypothetical protein
MVLFLRASSKPFERVVYYVATNKSKTKYFKADQS